MPEEKTPRAGPDHLITRYEQLRSELSSIDRQLLRGGLGQEGPEACTELSGPAADDVEWLLERMDQIDAELIGLEWHLPENFSYPDQPTE